MEILPSPKVALKHIKVKIVGSILFWLIGFVLLVCGVFKDDVNLVYLGFGFMLSGIFWTVMAGAKANLIDRGAK